MVYKVRSSSMPKKRQNSNKQPITSETKRSWNHWYQRPRNLIIIAVLVILVGAIGWSVYNFQIRPYNQTVIKYNNVSFNMRYFLNSLDAYYGKAPVDSSIADFADWVEQQIEQNQNIIQGSLALGVQIPRSNIVSELAKAGKPTNQANVDIQMAQDLVAKQVPASQPQYNIQAMLLESEEKAQSAIARLQAGEAFADVSSNLTKFSSTSNDAAALGWMTARQAELALGSTKFSGIIADTGTGVVSGPVYDDTVSKHLGYWVARMAELTYGSDNVTPFEIHIEAILLGSGQEAQDAVDKLNAGADLNELAKQVSLVSDAKDKGAEIGWLMRSTDPNLFDALVDLPVNTIIGPIEDNIAVTPGGYWVYNIIEKNDNQELNSYQQNLLETDLTDRCTAALNKNPDFKVENLLTQELKDSAVNKAVLAQGTGSVLIGMTSLPEGEARLNYYCKIKTYGEQNGNTWTITEGTLPQGLSLDAAKGVISGIPEFAGGGGFTIKVENSIHYSTQVLSYRLRMAISVTTESLPDGKVGEAYSQTLEAFADADSYVWSTDEGTLPDGLSLDKASGTISGTPSAAGTFSFKVQVYDGLGKDTQALTIKIE
jgi:parvulin-like peptidyl-prolyl isomerase